MTARPVNPECRRRPLYAAVALVLVMVAVLLAAGCVEQAMNDKSTSGNLNTQLPTPAATRPTLTLSSDSPIVYNGMSWVAESTEDVLIFWNDKMHWNLTPVQINEYSTSMENGVMKTYRREHEYPHALYFFNKSDFYRDFGNGLGFTQAESEDFVQALDDYQRQKNASYCPQWETCSPPKPIVLNFSVKPRPMITAT